MKTLVLTDAEYQALQEKLQVIMEQADGVDVWLSPGSETDILLLDCDEEAHNRLGSVLEKMGGSEANPHRDHNFKPELDSKQVWIVFQRGEDQQPESRPVTGVYSSRDKAVDAALQYLTAVSEIISTPTSVDDDEIIWTFGDKNQFECVASRTTLDS